jgi:cold-inducible RNA-binding protein
MATRLFVGSLAYTVTNEELEEFFASAGTVASAKVIVDHESNRSKGFGFVEMGSEEEAKAAIEQLDGTELNGRQIAVNEARPQESRGGNGGGPRRSGNGPRNAEAGGRRY